MEQAHIREFNVNNDSKLHKLAACKRAVKNFAIHFPFLSQLVELEMREHGDGKGACGCMNVTHNCAYKHAYLYM